MTQKQADYVGARLKYPAIDSLTATDWVQIFHDRPDLLHKLLGDIYAITKAQQGETRKSGRRAKHINGSLDELWDMLSPRYSTEPFGSALKELIGTQSLRAFAAKIPMHHQSLIRLMNGERRIVMPQSPAASLATLERIAKVANVHPAYFMEWRELVLLNAFQQALRANPSASITMTSALSVMAS